jgi:hypothetical protein
MNHSTLITRRSALKGITLGAGAALLSRGFAAEENARGTRGVVLYPFDLSLTDWPERAQRAGIGTIGLHAAKRLDVLRDFITDALGRRFLAQCEKLGIAVEYELHAMGELLSREWYHKEPAYFRVDAGGGRNIDANCCPHSTAALDIIAAKAVEWAKFFRPTTGRYFYWPDDGAQWCRCEKCRDFSASEQALLVENHILRALRAHDPRATLAHISYHHTLAAPVKVKPEPGVFLEFAPIERRYTHSIAERDIKTASTQSGNPATHGGYLDILAANMRVFGADTTQVLEYWLDVSLFSKWKRPAVKLPWNAAVCRADIAAYRALGVRHITTFATYIDADYVKLHGDPQPVLEEYGAAFKQP